MACRIWLGNAFYFRTSVFGKWTKKIVSLGPTSFWIQIQIFNDIFRAICLLALESVTVTEFEFSNFQPFFTSSWLDLTLTHWVWYTTQSFSHTNGRSDVTFAHFKLISPDFRYFFESVTTMIGASVLLTVCASPIPPNTSSRTQKTRLAGHVWSLWG